MGKDFLMTLLERSWRGELRPEQFKGELGWHVAELAGQIQDINSRCDRAAELSVAAAPPDEEFRARAIVDTWRVLAVRPLAEKRDVYTDRLIIDKALEVNRENPELAATLLALAL